MVVVHALERNPWDVRGVHDHSYRYLRGIMGTHDR